MVDIPRVWLISQERFQPKLKRFCLKRAWLTNPRPLSGHRAAVEHVGTFWLVDTRRLDQRLYVNRKARVSIHNFFFVASVRKFDTILRNTPVTSGVFVPKPLSILRSQHHHPVNEDISG